MHRVTKESSMTTQEARPAAAPTSPFPTGAGHFFPATAPGVPLSAFAFAFAVGFLGVLDTGMLPAAADGMLIALFLGIGTIGLFIGGMWEYRAGELFGGTFGLGYAGFLFSTGLFYKFFYGPTVTTAGANNTNHVLAVWFIGWAIFTAIFAIGARTIALAAVAPFTLAVLVLVLTVISEFGGTASWASDFAKAAGWVALLDCLAAGYLGAALVINTCYAKTICPLFPAKPRG
jgi:uncharacterized protein